MLIKQLTYFIAVVENHSFTKAAEQCFISQSAISQQIRALEKELKTELFKREKRSFTLTMAGDYLYHHGKSLLEEFDNLKNETKKHGDEELFLKIGFLKTYSSTELQEAVSEFTQLYPEVMISISDGTHEELYNDLIHGHVNLVISDQRRVFNEHYYNYELYMADCLVEIARVNPLSQKQILTTCDLKETSCILIASKDQQETEKDFYQNNFGFTNNFLYAHSLEAARLLVTNNRGFMPIEAFGTLTPSTGNIQRIPLVDQDHVLQRKFYAFWSKHNTNYYIEEFVEIFQHLLTQKNNK